MTAMRTPRHSRRDRRQIATLALAVLASSSPAAGAANHRHPTAHLQPAPRAKVATDRTAPSLGPGDVRLFVDTSIHAEHRSVGGGFRFGSFGLSIARVYDLDSSFTPISPLTNNQYVKIGDIGATNSFGVDFSYYRDAFEGPLFDEHTMDVALFGGPGLYYRKTTYIASSPVLGITGTTDDDIPDVRAVGSLGVTASYRAVTLRYAYHTLRGNLLGIGVRF